MKAVKTLAYLAAASAFYLLVAGAHVNAYQAALSVPDWPLSYGRILAAEWPGNVFYEQHHRAAVGATMVLVTATLIALARRRDLRRARFWGWRAGAALGVQVVMGGLIVLALNPPWLSVIHTLFAIVTVLLIAATALALGDCGGGGPEPDNPELARAGARARSGIWLVLLLVLLGSASRHPPLGELVFITTLIGHLLVAFLLLLWLSQIAITAWRNAPPGAVRRWAWLLLLALLLQTAAGATVLVVAPEPFDESWPPPAGFPNAHAAHVTLAAFVATCLLALRMRIGARDRVRKHRPSA